MWVSPKGQNASTDPLPDCDAPKNANPENMQAFKGM